MNAGWLSVDVPAQARGEKFSTNTLAKKSIFNQKVFMPYSRPYFFCLIAVVVSLVFFACDDSVNRAEGSSPNVEKDLSSVEKDLSIDDSEYPYAGIPRIVIETENRKKIKNCETEIPAKLQIWGKSAPESEILDLTIRGRGNSSWTDMPKKSYKIEFQKKQALLGMPKDKDWALIANYADKTLLKNYITYKLSSWLNAGYSPQCQFVELYLNQEYLGVYLVVETLKVNKNRINYIDETNFLAEFDVHYKAKDAVIFLKDEDKPVTVHYPKLPNDSTLSVLKNHLDSLNELIMSKSFSKDTLKKWIDFQSYFLFYWVQEFCENRDGNFATSVFFTWVPGSPVKMGPLWDFDLAYDGHPNVLTQDPKAWFIRNYYWNTALFKKDFFKKEANSYWSDHRQSFVQIIDSIEVYRNKLKRPAKNNFKRWPILKDTGSRYLTRSYSSYQAAVDSLEKWIKRRYKWIDSQN